MVALESGEILAERSSQEGVRSLSGIPLPEREQRFQEILQQQVSALVKAGPVQGDPLPVLISGMASSSIGWRELPYARTPFSLSGQDLQYVRLEGTGMLSRVPLFLFSGVRSDTDVMRGEEMELIGIDALLARQSAAPSNYQVILPGTHSKHAQVQQGRLVRFQTCLTGELFQLLGQHSSLRHAYEEMIARPAGEEEEVRCWEQAFADGVELSTREALIRSLFQTRTRQLLLGDTPLQAGGFLSGLLIGSELLTLRDSPQEFGPIILAAAPGLARPYELACQHLEMEDRINRISPEDVTRLSALGQARVLSRLLPIENGVARGVSRES